LQQRDTTDQDPETAPEATTTSDDASAPEATVAVQTVEAAAIAMILPMLQNLLTGLDLPWRPDGLQRDGAQVRAPVDALIRAALGSAGLPFAVVYGQGEARMAQALAAVRQRLGMPRPPAEGNGTDAGSTLRLRCRECMQPECEHRLFAALTRATADPA